MVLKMGNRISIRDEESTREFLLDSIRKKNRLPTLTKAFDLLVINYFKTEKKIEDDDFRLLHVLTFNLESEKRRQIKHMTFAPENIRSLIRDMVAKNSPSNGIVRAVELELKANSNNNIAKIDLKRIQKFNRIDVYDYLKKKYSGVFNKDFIKLPYYLKNLFDDDLKDNTKKPKDLNM